MPKNRELVIPDTPTSLEQPTEYTKGRPNKSGTYTPRLKYKTNPFIKAGVFSLKVENRTQVVAKNLKVIDEQKEQIADGAVIRYNAVDPDRFVKIYAANASAFFKLNKTAQRTLIILIAAVQDQSKDKAEVYLTHAQAVEYCKRMGEKPQDRTSFSKGMQTLIDAQFIAVSEKGIGWYWTNPQIMFNGSRVAFIELVIDKAREELAQFDKEIENKIKKKTYIQNSMIEGESPYSIEM